MSENRAEDDVLSIGSSIFAHVLLRTLEVCMGNALDTCPWRTVNWIASVFALTCQLVPATCNTVDPPEKTMDTEPMGC
jgi:hypothetical protein